MNILFLCTGNTCRSPMAEALARAAFAGRAGKLNFSSAGLMASPGRRASENAALAMERRGLNISGHATAPATADTLDKADIIIAMSESHARHALALSPACGRKLFTLRQLAEDSPADVADPFGGDIAAYERCAGEIEAAVTRLAGGAAGIALGCDHGGFALKTEIISHLNKKGLKFIDFGTDSAESADYPVFAGKVTDAVLSGLCGKGVLLCGTGIGVSIAANRLPGVRCALCHDAFSAKAARSHNDANILAMGGRVIGAEAALDVLDAFLATEFSGCGRHIRRIAQIDER